MELAELCNQFLDFLQQRCCGSRQEKIGLEYETFVTLPSEHGKWGSLPISGDVSIGTLLLKMAESSSQGPQPWELYYEGELLLGLLHSIGQNISIEPGGQVELSDSPRIELSEVAQAVSVHTQQLTQALSGWGGMPLFLGVHPFLTPDDLPLLDKKRYRIMYSTMKDVDSHGQWMMKATSGVQVSLDYQSLEDLERKFVILNRLTPFLTAIFANSPIVKGEPSGYRSYRGRIWQNTDPYRTGLPPSFLSKKFSLVDYIEWALDASPYHLYRYGAVVQPGPYTFRQLLQKETPLEVTQDDWLIHLGMLFPEVRIKRIMELRCMDTQQPQDVIAVPALLQTLTYNENVLEDLEGWLMDIPADLYPELRKTACKDGLAGEVGPIQFNRFAIKIMESALTHMDSSNQANWLEPFFDRYTKQGLSPADLVIQRYHAANSFDSWLSQELYLHSHSTLN
jgi:glutamate--cysteine ligase